MVTSEGATKAWAKLEARWGTMLAQSYPEGLRRADFTEGLMRIPAGDQDLLAAVEHERDTRVTLYPHDNLVAILRARAVTIREARERAEAHADGQRRHAEDLARLKAPALPGRTADLDAMQSELDKIKHGQVRQAMQRLLDKIRARRKAEGKESP